MSILSLEIFGLRSFGVSQTLNPSLPTGGDGSGLTVLVGSNNSGKSTIVEAFRTLNRPDEISFTEGKRNKQAGDVVRIRAINEDGRSRTLQTVGLGGSEARWDSATAPDQGSMFVLPSRRTFDPYFGKDNADRSRYVTAWGIPSLRSSSINQFSARLFQIQQKRGEFDLILGKVLDPLPKWYIDQNDSGQYYLKFQSGESYHTSEGIGEGFISLFFIVDALYDSKPSQTIVIDEPELSLHPSLQKKVMRLVSEFATDRQIIISTHSPYFIHWDAIFNGGKVVRVNKIGDHTHLFELTSGTAARLAHFLRNTHNPHVLGLDAREVFFLEDSLILVEGQEDVVHYNRIAEQTGVKLSGDFFGWGVGGADNMSVVARMLSELGFSKVVGILDGNRADLVAGLQNDYSKYKFVVIPADDVRTKPAVPARPSVTGLLDERGNLRGEHRSEMSRLFDEINEFLGQRQAMPKKTASEVEASAAIEES